MNESLPTVPGTQYVHGTRVPVRRLIRGGGRLTGAHRRYYIRLGHIPLGAASKVRDGFKDLQLIGLRRRVFRARWSGSTPHGGTVVRHSKNPRAHFGAVRVQVKILPRSDRL